MAKTSWDSLDPEDLSRLKDKNLRRQVRFQLYAFSPFYRRLLDETGVHSSGFEGLADLAKLPLIDRATLAISADEFVLSPSRDLVQRWGSSAKLTESVVNILLRGDAAFDKELAHEYSPVHALETSGTTGEPIPIRLSRRDFAVLATQGRRMMEVAGLTQEDILLNQLEPIPAGGFWALWSGAVGLGLQQIAPGLIEPDRAAVLAGKMQATALAARAEDALAIFEAAGRLGLPGLKTLILPPEESAGMRRRLAEYVPGLRIIGTYGFAEGRALWAECAAGAGAKDSGYHLTGDFELFEVLSPGTGLSAGEGATAELVFTGLDQRGTALARYRPGDVAVGGLRSDRCAYCGRTVERIIGPIRRASSLLQIQLAGGDPVAVDVDSFASALAHPQVSSWRVEVSKTEGDPRGPDEVYVLFNPISGEGGEIAVDLDRAFRKEIGLSPTQFIVSGELEPGVVDQRPVLAGPLHSGNGKLERPRVRVWRRPT